MEQLLKQNVQPRWKPKSTKCTSITYIIVFEYASHKVDIVEWKSVEWME
jgi:hypothetical protein